MNLGRHKGVKIKGGRTSAKIIDDWELVEVVCEPPSKIHEKHKKGSRNSRNRRGGYVGGVTPQPNPDQYLLKSEDWPELPKLDNRELVTTSREKSEAEEEPTIMSMDGENIEDSWGGPVVPVEGPTTLTERENNMTKAPNFDLAEFLESHPDLPEMELAVVMAINYLHKQKVLSNKDQTGLMYHPVGLNTYQTPASEGSFLYPPIPLYSILAKILDQWMLRGACYAKDLITYEHLDEGDGIDKRKIVLDNATCHMIGIGGSWEGSEDDEKKHKISQLFRDIGKRGLLDLLGVRRTVGTEDTFPPTRDILQTSFRELNKASSQLTVGARALEKHCHRDQSNNWWGRPKGNDQSKNENAERVLNKILNEVGWLNIHQLPHALPILEVRNTDGYGARWSPDGKEFRGFLEPPMIAGWETGYKH
ncbi:uncharacterized protein LOC100888873 [Strongylocentrotus purpuratus]|uniref:Uncharacterized protein n=1 Tax=Strongylocentrotus purpuratus TaxID=7668 RepID=A0A7M7NQY6_STRPU|nr:uncharacterized protein LOC100888873 [Strongylocentrotus purpuratus]XP_030840358.1 uncharacterized protein LOC100888873 [Strongylocentrotus purpuratus]